MFKFSTVVPLECAADTVSLKLNSATVPTLLTPENPLEQLRREVALLPL